jgi:hypothetical protein
MKQLHEHGTVAILKLQQIQPLCEKAIEQFNHSSDVHNTYQIRAVEQSSRQTYAWIDSSMFTESLVSLLKDISRCKERQLSDITISLRQIGHSRCQVVISDDGIPDLSKCEGPFDISNNPRQIADLQTIQSVVTMHGGYIQAWKGCGKSNAVFEINLLCMSYNDGGINDYSEA